VSILLPTSRGTVLTRVHFSADSPPMYDPGKHPIPANPTQGRQNNQGFEGLTISSDGKKLYTLLQSAARQEGGSNAATRRYTRLLQYSLGGDSPTPVYEAEYVVPLPTFTNAAGQQRVAAQSELHYAEGTQFFFLPRDSNVGQTYADTQSVYRHVDVFDIAGATNLAGAAQCLQCEHGQHRGGAERRHHASDGVPFPRHQRQCSAQPVWPAQRRSAGQGTAEREVGGHRAGSGFQLQVQDWARVLHVCCVG
jgi:hypothetical protein